MNAKNTNIIPRFTRLTAWPVSIACGLSFSAQADEVTSPTLKVKDVLGVERTLSDFDGDGWDDVWCAIYRDVTHRDKTVDTDSDGLTDYEEMVMSRDPLNAEPHPEAAQAQVAAPQKTKEEKWKEKCDEVSGKMLELIPEGETASQKKKEDAQERTEKLKAKALDSLSKRSSKDEALDKIASNYGTGRELETSKGRKKKKKVLMGESLGPVYVQSDDTLSAAGISADELWKPVSWWPYTDSVTGHELSGAGQTLGMWEVGGGVRTSHVEFGTNRVFQKDGAAVDMTDHATKVAGTMAGAGATAYFGYFSESRGVAYKANVFAYGLDVSFRDELEFAAAGNATDPPLMLSNHSWGFVSGWHEEDIDPSANENLQWVWYGPRDASFQEDHKFGHYLADPENGIGSDDIDRFMNELAPQHLMVFSAGNERAQGPGIAQTYYCLKSAGGYDTIDPNLYPRDWSNGDEGGYDTVHAPGTAKNALTIGAVQDVYHYGSNGYAVLGYAESSHVVPAEFSGAGPTDDGRIKPDLVAVGDSDLTIRSMLALANGSTSYIFAPGALADDDYVGNAKGTSFAAASVTGTLGLIQERIATLYPELGAGEALLASSLKAVAINSADDVGAEGPDYKMGHGLINARSAVLAIDADHAAGRGSSIKEFDLNASDSVSWVVESDGTEPLSVTVAWTDVAGVAETVVLAADSPTAKLVNNIDLKVEFLDECHNPTETYLPWVLNPDLTNKSSAVRSQAATRGVDNLNNVEKVSVKAPHAGRYKITVVHSGGVSGGAAPTLQSVSAVTSGVTPEAPVVTDLVPSPTGTELLVSFTSDPGAYFTIQTSEDLLTWTDAGSVQATSNDNSVLIAGNGALCRFVKLKRGQ